MLELIFTVLVCFGIPLAGLVLSIKWKKGCWKSFLTGIAVFLIFQVFTRIPILNMLSTSSDWFMIMTSVYPWIYAVILGFTAGLFEEVGRYLGFRTLCRKNQTWRDGLTFGLGHGGVEAVLIGIQVVANVALTGQTQGIAVVGFERLCTIVVHVGLTMIVLYGVRRKQIRYLILAIAVHTLLDIAVVVLPGFLGAGLILTEGVIALTAMILLWVIIKMKKGMENCDNAYNFNTHQL